MSDQENAVVDVNETEIYDEQAHHKAIPKGSFRREAMIFFILLFLLTPILLSPFFYVCFTKGIREAMSMKVFEAFKVHKYMILFARLSVLLGLCCFSYAFNRIIYKVIPLAILSFKKDIKPSFRRNLICFLQTSSYWSMVSFLLSLIVILATNAYDTTLMGMAIDTLSQRLQGKDVKGVETPNTALFYIERLSLCASILAFTLAIAKYAVCRAKYGFHETTFGNRIRDVNQKLFQLTQTYLKASGGSHEVSASDFVDNTKVVDAIELDLNSERRAKAIAWTVFRSNNVSRDIFPIDDNPNEQACVDNVLSLYKESVNIQKILDSNSRIIKKLDSLVSTIAIIIGLLLCTPFLDLGFSSLWAGFLALFAALGFALQSVGRTSFEAFLFIFVVHAFDIGDTVSIDNDKLIVSDLEIFTSIFRKAEDHTIVYAPNSSLSGKNIANITRSQQENTLPVE